MNYYDFVLNAGKYHQSSINSKGGSYHMKKIRGGVTAAKGFYAASAAAGIKYKDRKDMALDL